MSSLVICVHGRAHYSGSTPTRCDGCERDTESMRSTESCVEALTRTVRAGTLEEVPVEAVIRAMRARSTKGGT